MEARNDYDELPYPGHVVPSADPTRLARASRTHGGPVPPTGAFALLELGCGDGTHLRHLAETYPRASLVGLDAAAGPLRAAEEAARDAGLGSIRFLCADLAEEVALDGPAGGFHYVVAHGVYSWVDERARTGLLRLAARHLAADGLLYLSYNVRAGWIVRGITRELLRAATEAQVDDPAARVRAAREAATSMHAAIAGSDHPYHALLAGELERANDATDAYLFHELLAPANDAFDHPAVVAQVARHGLRYLCDARFDEPEGSVPEGLREVLAGFDDAQAEQAADLLGHRRFRAAVFCLAAPAERR